MKIRSSRGIFLLCGGIFALVGTISLAVSVFLARHMDDVHLHGEGNAEILPIIFGVNGLIALGVSVAVFLTLRERAVMRKYLRERGETVMAEITGFPADYNVRVNRRPTWRIECRYQDPRTGIAHIFRSEGLTENPSRFVSASHVRVYVSRESDYQEYYVDAGSVLPETRQH